MTLTSGPPDFVYTTPRCVFEFYSKTKTLNLEPPASGVIAWSEELTADSNAAWKAFNEWKAAKETS